MENHKPIKILKVKPLDNPQKLPRDMPDYLPQMNGEVIMVVAPIAQGKSNFVSNWFLNQSLAEGMFDTIYFLSNTAHQDTTSRFLIDEPNVIVYDDLNSAKVDTIIDSIIETQ